MNTSSSIIIGEYCIYEPLADDEWVCMERADGEGGEFSVSKDELMEAINALAVEL